MHVLPVKIFRYLIFRFCKILSIIWRNIAESTKQKQKKRWGGVEFDKIFVYLPSKIGPIIQSLYME